MEGRICPPSVLVGLRSRQMPWKNCTYPNRVAKNSNCLIFFYSKCVLKCVFDVFRKTREELWSKNTSVNPTSTEGGQILPSTFLFHYKIWTNEGFDPIFSLVFPKSSKEHVKTIFWAPNIWRGSAIWPESLIACEIFGNFWQKSYF